MTDRERLELERERLKLELEIADHGAAEQSTAAPAAEPSLAASALSGVQNVGSFGFGDELGAGLQAVLARATGTGDFGDTYRRARDENRAESKAARDAHPVAYYAAGLPAAVGASLALPAFKAAQGAPLLLRALAGAGNGLVQGVIAGAGDSEADTLGGVAKDAGIAGAMGAGVGSVLPVAGAALRRAGGALVRGVVQPSEAAQSLGRLGVDTSRLSLGQLDPEGPLALMEEGGEHNAAVGPALKRIREGGREAWRDAVMSRSTAPYQPLTGGSAAEQLEAANRGFGTAYGTIGENPIATAGPGQQSVADQLRGSFRQAVENPSVLATDAERNAVGGYLQNQATALRFRPGQQSTVGDLQGVRSDVRRALHQALGGAAPDHARGEMLRSAEQALTGQIEGNLPAAERSALRATDARYGSHKIIEDAIARAADKPEGLTPANLSSAVKADTARGVYARGGGGDLRELASVGREVLDSKTPPTGVRTLISALPFQKYWGPPVAAIANTNPTARALALGETAAQQRTRALIEALRGETAEGLSDALEREAAARIPSPLRPYFYDAGSISRGSSGALAQREVP